MARGAGVARLKTLTHCLTPVRRVAARVPVTVLQEVRVIPAPMYPPEWYHPAWGVPPCGGHQESYRPDYD